SRLRVGPEHVGGAFLIALAFASSTWSAFPRLSIGRAGAFGLVLIACGALTLVSAGRLRSIQRFLEAVVGAAAAVAIGGLLVLLFGPHRAIEAATSVLPAPYQGLCGGPDAPCTGCAVARP